VHITPVVPTPFHSPAQPLASCLHRTAGRSDRQVTKQAPGNATWLLAGECCSSHCAYPPPLFFPTLATGDLDLSNRLDKRCTSPQHLLTQMGELDRKCSSQGHSLIVLAAVLHSLESECGGSGCFVVRSVGDSGVEWCLSLGCRTSGTTAGFSDPICSLACGTLGTSAAALAPLGRFESPSRVQALGPLPPTELLTVGCWWRSWWCVEG